MSLSLMVIVALSLANRPPPRVYAVLPVRSLSVSFCSLQNVLLLFDRCLCLIAFTFGGLQFEVRAGSAADRFLQTTPIIRWPKCMCCPCR